MLAPIVMKLKCPEPGDNSSPLQDFLGIRFISSDSISKVELEVCDLKYTQLLLTNLFTLIKIYAWI